MRALTPQTARLLEPCGISSSDRMHLSLNLDGNKFVARITAQSTKWGNALPSNGARSRFPLRVPERKELVATNAYLWEFAATDITASIIHALWDSAQLSFDDDAKVTYDYLLVTGATHDRNAETVAEYREDKVAPMLKYAERDGLDLCLYQRLPTWNALHSESYGLFMEQGTGKTPIVVARVSIDTEQLNLSRMYRCLVVAPKNVRTNWVTEFERFSRVPHRTTVLRGGQIDRVKSLIDALAPSNGTRATVVVVSYETMVRMVDTLRAVEWDLIVLDESHFIKWPLTKRSQAAHKLRDAGKRRMVLTGTPIANNPLDLYSQLEFLGQGWSGFMSWKAFRSFYGVYYQKTQNGRSSLVGVQNMPFMRERLARVSYICRKEEVLKDLPAKTYDVIETEMSAHQQEVYESVRDKLIAQVNDELDNAKNKTLVINNILTKLLRLAQITSGYVSWDPDFDDEAPMRSVERFDPCPKLEALVEGLKARDPNQKTIIWSCWVQNIKTIAARLELEGIKCVTYYGGTKDDDREEAVRSFNCDRDVRVFIGNPAAGGTGLNLLGYPPGAGEDYETNCDWVVYYSQNWSHPTRAQSEDRAHRRGTRAPVRVTDLVVPCTIDEEIRTAVTKKRITAYEISDVREILKAVLRGIAKDE